MKKNYIWIVAAAVAAVGYFVYRKMNFANSLVFRLSDVKPDSNLKDPKLIISIAVSNPTNQKANIKAITGTLYIDEREISIVNTTTQQTIQPSSDSIIRINAKPSIFGIAKIIRDLLYKSKRQKMTENFRFLGNVNVDGVLLPIDEQFKF